MTIKIIAIVGPTASGKSALAVRLAKKFSGEIISADSRQVYKGLDIGTGKVSRDKTKSQNLEARLAVGQARTYLHQDILHHLLDVADPRRTFTALRYKRLAERAVREITARGRVPIFCGGTGFYLDIALGRMDVSPVPPNPALRRKLEKLSTEKLFAKLQALDQARAEKIDRHNRRRLIRALEIASADGKGNPSELKGSPFRDTKDYPWKTWKILKIGLGVEKEKLKELINIRLHKRLKQGLIAEVKRLRARGLSWKRLDDLGLEYRYVSYYLRDLMKKDEMIKKLETEIYRYAKRQLTWFKRNQEINWIEKPSLANRLVCDFLRK